MSFDARKFIELICNLQIKTLKNSSKPCILSVKLFLTRKCGFSKPPFGDFAEIHYICITNETTSWRIPYLRSLPSSI